MVFVSLFIKKVSFITLLGRDILLNADCRMQKVVRSNDAAFRDYIAALQIVTAVFRKQRRKEFKRLPRILYNTAVAVVVRW